MTHSMMLDIETLGIGQDALVWQVGICFFDPYGPAIGPHTLFLMDRSEQLSLGRKVEANTVEWTNTHGDREGYLRWLYADGGHLTIKMLSNIIENHLASVSGDPARVEVWARGASFDFAIMRALFRSVGLSEPWHFRNERCMRTFDALIPEGDRIMLKPESCGRMHNAENDSIYQAKSVQNMIRWMNQNKSGLRFE